MGNRRFASGAGVHKERGSPAEEEELQLPRGFVIGGSSARVWDLMAGIQSRVLSKSQEKGRALLAWR